VSAIIAVYNGADQIRRAIDSVLAQTQSVDELIVVDDGSTDATPQVVTSYGDRVRYVRQQNGGVAAARNNGIRSATSEWVALLDHDDEWLPQKIERQLEMVRANPKAALCYSAYWSHWLGRESKIVYRPIDQLWPASRLTNPFPPSVIMFRRKEMLDLGGFDEKLKGASCEDWDLSVRFLQKYPAVGVSEPLTNYYEVPTSNSRNYRVMLPNTLSIVDKSLLLGLQGVSKAVWRRRIKSVLYYRAAISARDLGDSALGLLLSSLIQWPLPDLEPQRLKTVIAELIR
jgi:glycosyltransferase involved in cell wall biosynthesis